MLIDKIPDEIASRLQEQTLCPNSNQGAVSSEDIDHYGFSWLPSLEDSTEERPISYTDILHNDAIFYNPTNITLMATAYDVNQYDTFKLKQAPGDWNYKTMTKTRNCNISAKMLENGIYRIRQNRYDEAITILNDAINLNDENVEAYVARGAAYANRGMFIKAIADFEKALELAPQHTHALEYLTQTKAKHDAACGKTVRSSMVSQLTHDDTRTVSSHDSDDKDKAGHKRKRKSKKSSKSSDRKQHKKKKHKKDRKHRSRSSNSSDSSSEHNSDHQVHPILQREKHKLWG